MNAAVAEENSEILNEQANYELSRMAFIFIHITLAIDFDIPFKPLL